MNHWALKSHQRWLTALLWPVLFIPLALYAVAVFRRSPRAPITQQLLFQGITYSRLFESTPRPQVLHLLAIDLTAPGLSPFVTPGFAGSQPNIGAPLGRETLAQHTTHFLQTHRLQLAVNANFFYPFHENTPWDYSPKENAPTNLIGLAISDGQVVSLPEAGRPALCFLPRRAIILDAGECPPGTEQAVAGIARLLVDSQLTETALARRTNPPKAYPLNIVAIDPSGTQLWLLLSDGKQALYSEGTTLQEAALLLQDLGAEIALQLDGGGSTTLAIETGGAPKILNGVIHTKIPGRERPVANHLGFYANPVP